jgi:hypothetical protein
VSVFGPCITLLGNLPANGTGIHLVALFRHRTPELSRGGPKKGPTFVSAPDLFSFLTGGSRPTAKFLTSMPPELSDRSRRNRPPFFRFHGALSDWVRRRPGVTFLGNRYRLARFSQRDAPPLPACPLPRMNRRLTIENRRIRGCLPLFPNLNKTFGARERQLERPASTLFPVNAPA